MKADGHVHTPFCPHGSTDKFDEYITRGIELGLKEITFTEHAPLPRNFQDPTPEKDSGMDAALLLNYFQELRVLKERYKDKILIKTGLEVDFIEGYEKETKEFLDEIGEFLDDSILSVHFIKHQNSWHCIDFSEIGFAEIANELGSVESVYAKYYDTLEKSIETDLGIYKPKRIGHITLVHKFQHRYPPASSFDERVYKVLEMIKDQRYELDYNGAGLVKPLCGEPYPPERFAKRALELGIPLIYGSDAHQAKDLGQGHQALIEGYNG
ncbi:MULTISPECIES: histidinol-phosphatase HisJ [Bacillaceae]|uniref:histidinol-phosphatase HisJ n=1 Tax=Bacillaceae TaxID=186817 RepID=UPI00066069DF|nr:MULTISPECIES: histidinol-phosphatase HisJ [Bacillaceae]MCF7623908.1 histidinol-phosphatase HisJ [Peribacillus frigoritolerans]PRA95470.1 histidinol phosphatase [Peribacillus simplex]